VEGRIEPTITTGLSVFTVRLRKNADSSIVSVPCVITKPSTSFDLASSLMRFATFMRMSKLMSCEPTLEICSPLMLASLVMPGTAATIVSMPTAPDV
jgi:hypothetical protein